jgi:hypothetical protein
LFVCLLPCFLASSNLEGFNADTDDEVFLSLFPTERRRQRKMTNCSCNTQPSHNLAAYIYIYILILEHGQRTSLSTVSWWLATFPDQGPVDGKPTPTAHAEVICAGGLLQACDLWQGFPGVNHPLAATVSCKILKRHALDASQQVGQNRARAAISCVGAIGVSVHLHGRNWRHATIRPAASDCSIVQLFLPRLRL